MTDANDSNLTIPELGYDFVTAVTQNSINAAISDHLDVHNQKTISICYVAEKGVATLISFEELLKRTNGTDPFTIPEFPEEAKPSEDARIQDLSNASFLRGFRCRLGNPPMTENPMTDPSAVSEVPDFVTLGDDTSNVLFNLLCAECSVVEYTPLVENYFEEKWVHRKQEIDDPWIFQSKVDLRLEPVASEKFETLPEEVLDRIKNLGETAFSVEQLVFDFQNAAISSRPKWINPNQQLGQMLIGGPFSGTYFDIMKKRGEPLLGCLIKKKESSTQKASLQLTDFKFKICPFLDSNGKVIAKPTKEQQGLATLNYLCATGGREVERRNAPAWNWLSEADTREKHGVISINRNTFAEYLRPILWRYFSPNCVIPLVSCNSPLPNQAGLFSWAFVPNGPEEVLHLNTEGDDTFTINWDKEGYDKGKINEAKIEISYKAKVQFKATSIIIRQEVSMYTYLAYLGPWFGATWLSVKGYPIHKIITDTYSIGVDAYGKIRLKNSPEVVDKPQKLEYGQLANYFPELQPGMDNLVSYISTSNVELESLPLSVLSDFVFPGGKTFAFHDARFSKHRDLIASIRYTS
jgi:hypothetical protein